MRSCANCWSTDSPCLLAQKTDAARVVECPGRAIVQCKPAEVRQLTRLLNVGKLARGRWWFTWAELEILRKYRDQKTG